MWSTIIFCVDIGIKSSTDRNHIEICNTHILKSIDQNTKNKNTLNKLGYNVLNSISTIMYLHYEHFSSIVNTLFRFYGHLIKFIAKHFNNFFQICVFFNTCMYFFQRSRFKTCRQISVTDGELS